MPYNGTGTFAALAPPVYPAVTGTVIDADYFNQIIDDIRSGLSNAITRNGQSAPTANLPMGGRRFTGAADAVSGDEFTTLSQVSAMVSGGSATYNVKAFGALGDGVTDDTVAIQAAITAAITTGGVVFFPHGEYIISSTLLLDYSAFTTNPPKVTFSGEDNSSSRVTGAAGAYSMFEIRGGTLGGVVSVQAIERLLINKLDALGSVVKLDNLAYFWMTEVTLGGGAKQLDVTDVIVFTLTNLTCIIGARGITASISDFSPPNAWTLINCVIGGNTEYGALFTGPACVNIIGGTIEGNATAYGTTLSTSGWGIKCVDSASGGAVGLNMVGTYVEDNGGLADVWITSTSDKSSHSLTGVSFGRVSSARYTRNNVFLEAAGAGTVINCVMTGCGFKSFNTYSPNAARPYVQTSEATGGIARFTWAAPLWEDAVELPTVQSFWEGQHRFLSGTNPANISATEAGQVTVAQTAVTGGSGTKSPFAIDYSLPNGFTGNARGLWSRVTSDAAAGAHTAVYGESWTSRAGSSVWGGVLDAKDTSGNTSSNTAVGLQVNHGANGSTGAAARAGISIVVDKGNPGGTANVVSRGLQFTPAGGSLAAGSLQQGIQFDISCSGAALKLQNSADFKYIIEAENADNIQYLLRAKTAGSTLIVSQANMLSTVLGGVKIIIDTFEYAVPFVSYTGAGQVITI